MRHLLLSALLAVPASSAPMAKKAPEIKLPVLYNAPTPSLGALAELKGKVVFMEFWATWCAPCVAGFARTNRIIDALKGEPVVFLAITDEEPGLVAGYMKKREFKGWIGVDEKAASFKAYKVRGRPDGFLIGRNGELLARLSPEALEEKDIRAALAGTFAPRPVEREERFSGEPAKPAAAATFFEATISSASGPSGMSVGAGTLQANSLPFAFAVSWIWNVQSSQVVAENPPVAKFNFRLKTPPDGFEEGREMLKSAVQSAFGVDVVVERRETDSFVIKRSTVPGAPLPKTPSENDFKSGTMSSGGGRYLGRTGIDGLAQGLWMGLGVPVFDETGLKGEFMLDLEWENDDRAALDRALATVGLVLVPARRKSDFYRVVRRPEKKKP